MKTKIKFYLGVALFILGVVFYSCVFAQQALPQGGSSFETAVLLSPGKYQGGALVEWQDPIYYSIQVKAGQEINIEAKSFAESGCSMYLFNEAQEELVSDYATNPKVSWLPNADKGSYKYYLEIANDASAVESFSLEISLTNYYDANSQTDAGSTFESALNIVPGSYDGYFSKALYDNAHMGDDDQDFYKVSVQKGIPYEFKVTPSAESGIALELYDATRQLIDEKESANDGAMVSLFLTPAANTNVFLAVKSDVTSAILNYKLNIKSSASVIKFYVCKDEYCETVGEFSSLGDCQKATTKTCYQALDCNGKCDIFPPHDGCVKNSDCPAGYPSCVDGQCIDTGEEPPSDSCQDECNVEQTKCFDNFNYYKCGDYNKDDCLEWSSPVYCGEGNKCGNGKCAPAPGGCQCSEWAEGQCGVDSCPEDEISVSRTCLPTGCDIKKSCVGNSSCQVIPPPSDHQPFSFSFLNKFSLFGKLPIFALFGGFYLFFWMIFYIYIAVCLQVLAKKTAVKNGWMAWVPIANIFLMINLAKKPLWWFILILIPFVNIVIGILLWMAIAERRNKPNWVGVLIIVPLVGIAVPGYLAFFDHKKGEKIESTLPNTSTGTQEANKPTVGYKHACKYCAKLIPPNSLVCPLCKKSNPLGPFRCPKCHEPIEKDWQVCSNCNQDLRIVCPFCKKITFFGDHCEDCNKRLLVTCSHCGQEQPPLGDKCIKCGQLTEKK